jgi:beta-lactamase class A
VQREGLQRARKAADRGFWRSGSSRLIIVAVFIGIALVIRPLSGQSVQETASIELLKADIERVTKSVKATWGVYLKCLETSESIALDADRQMETMSVIKIPLMVEVFEQIKAGKFKLEEKYTLTSDDMLPGTGILRSLEPGAVVSVKDLVTLMIIVSDNTATDVLYRMVGGPGVMNRRMTAIGLKATRAETNGRQWFDALRVAPDAEQFYREGKHPFALSTPREIGMLLEQMEHGTLVDKPSSDLMLQIMRAQIYRSRIPRFLTGYRVPHKTGDFLPYVGNDVGVLEMPGRTVVISIFTANHFGAGDRLEEAIGRVAEHVASYFSYRQ